MGAPVITERLVPAEVVPGVMLSSEEMARIYRSIVAAGHLNGERVANLSLLPEGIWGRRIPVTDPVEWSPPTAFAVTSTITYTLDHIVYADSAEIAQRTAEAGLSDWMITDDENSRSVQHTVRCAVADGEATDLLREAGLVSYASAGGSLHDLTSWVSRGRPPGRLNPDLAEHLAARLGLGAQPS